MREIELPGFDKAILSDTVGFISELPTQLVAAFRATLEEVISADIIVHVRDISHPDSDAQREDVEQVLAEIGAGGATGEGTGAPMIEAWNKIDALEGEALDRVRAEGERRDNVVLISALNGEGVEALLECASRRLREGSEVRTVRLPLEQGEATAWLHANGEVLGQSFECGGEAEIEVRLSKVDWARFDARWRAG
jgi:GTP-binding protein HflX